MPALGELVEDKPEADKPVLSTLEKERFFLFQEKIGTKKNVYLYSGKSGTKRNVSIRPGNEKRREINA
jgi:hypothetical protein